MGTPATVHRPTGAVNSPTGKAESAPQVSKKPKLEDLLLSDQVKAFDLALNRAAAARQEKVARVAAKTRERYERRYLRSIPNIQRPMSEPRH